MVAKQPSTRPVVLQLLRAAPAERPRAAPSPAVRPLVEQQQAARPPIPVPQQADARPAAPPSAATPPPVLPASGLAICRTTTRAQTPRLVTATPAVAAPAGPAAAAAPAGPAAAAAAASDTPDRAGPPIVPSAVQRSAIQRLLHL